VSYATLILKVVSVLGWPIGRRKWGRFVLTLMGKRGLDALSARRHKKVENVTKSWQVEEVVFGLGLKVL
jgi:hypothetical protein